MHFLLILNERRQYDHRNPHSLYAFMHDRT